jgi:hypothetical protein
LLRNISELYNENSINIKDSDEKLNDLFKNKVVNNKVYMDWFSGNIALPSGDLLRWDGVFYKSFEQETIIKIKNGMVKKVSLVDNYIDETHKINRRQNDTISNVLFQEIRLLDWEKLDECGCAEAYIVTIGKNGKVKDVLMAGYPPAKIEEYWDKKDYRYCIDSILKSLKKLEFDIIKLHGVKVKEDVYIEIFYDSDVLENWTYQ